MGIVSTILLAAALLLFLAGAFFMFQALTTRRSLHEGAYGVEKQEKSLGIRINIARGILFLFLGLIFLAAYVLLPSANGEELNPTAVPTASQQPQATRVELSTATITEVRPTSIATSSLPSRTPFPTDTPEPTGTPILPSAIVVSPNGLWLREAPGGSQELELIPDGALLILLEGRQSVEDVEWQEVRTPSDLEGWVAVEFIEYQQ